MGTPQVSFSRLFGKLGQLVTVGVVNLPEEATNFSDFFIGIQAVAVFLKALYYKASGQQLLIAKSSVHGNLLFVKSWSEVQCESSLLRLGTCGTFVEAPDMAIWKPRLLSTKILAGRNPKQESSKRCNIKLDILDGTVERIRTTKDNKSELTEIKRTQYSDVEQKIAEERKSAQLATIIVVDIETTGFSVREDRIIEIALQDIAGGKNSTFQTLVNPGVSVPNTHVHGIKSSMVNRPNIPRWKDLAPVLIQYVRSRQKAGGPIVCVAHNGRRFDIPFIVKEFSSCSVEIPPDWLFLDTLPIAKLLVKPDGKFCVSSILLVVP
ncbi:hypothetical protein ACLOJK_017718 [Asimina triloba]